MGFDIEDLREAGQHLTGSQVPGGAEIPGILGALIIAAGTGNLPQPPAEEQTPEDVAAAQQESAAAGNADIAANPPTITPSPSSPEVT